MDTRTQLTQPINLRGRNVVAGIHQRTVQIQFRCLGPLQVQGQFLLPPHVRCHDLLAVPGLSNIRIPACKPSGFRRDTVMGGHCSKALSSPVRGPGQDDDIGKQRIHRNRSMRVQPELPFPGNAVRRSARDQRQRANDKQPTFHNSTNVRFFAENCYFCSGPVNT